MFKKYCLLLVIISSIGLFFTQCARSPLEINEPLSENETKSPIIMKILAPENEAKVKGQVKIEVMAESPAGIKQVNFSLLEKSPSSKARIFIPPKALATDAKFSISILDKKKLPWPWPEEILFNGAILIEPMDIIFFNNPADIRIPLLTPAKESQIFQIYRYDPVKKTYDKVAISLPNADGLSLDFLSDKSGIFVVGGIFEIKEMMRSSF